MLNSAVHYFVSAMQMKFACINVNCSHRSTPVPVQLDGCDVCGSRHVGKGFGKTHKTLQGMYLESLYLQISLGVWPF